jgi:hypothetical protein
MWFSKHTVYIESQKKFNWLQVAEVFMFPWKKYRVDLFLFDHKVVAVQAAGQAMPAAFLQQ